MTIDRSLQIASLQKQKSELQSALATMPYQRPVDKELASSADKVIKQYYPKIQTTEQQQAKLSSRYKLVAMMSVRFAYALENKINWETDYRQGNLLYILHQDDQGKESGFPFMCFLFINDDRNVRRRIEKRLKQKFEWFIFDMERYRQDSFQLENIYF